MKSPIYYLEWTTRYYIFACFGPLRTSLIAPFYRPLLILLYIISRGFGISKVLYEFLLSAGLFESIHGPNDTFGYIEAALWALAVLPYVACDILFLNSGFLHNVDRCFLEMKRIYQSTKFVPKVYIEGPKGAKFKTLRFILFSQFLDWFQNINTFIAMQGTMMERSNVYSVLPLEWQTPSLETVFWFLESFNLAVLFNAISMMTCLPGVWAYYIEECLRRMTAMVEYETDRLVKGQGDGYKPSGVVEKMMVHYRNLFWAAREVNKRLGWGAMSFNTTNCAQQTAETFVIFQLLKAGAMFDDVQFLLTDIFVSEQSIEL